jgi:ribosomal protein S18 acetylase RimI-like enzyme
VIPTLSLIPAIDADQDLLLELFAGSRAAELAAAGLDQSALAAMVSLQFRAQQTHYRAAFPAAVDHVIHLDGRPVGRCWVDRATGEVRLMDLIVDAGHRRQGIAERVVQDLQAEAAAHALPLRLSVWSSNEPARALYARAGFVVRSEDGGYLQLEWLSPDRSRSGAHA